MSGHARLKQALVLRDALAGTLGLRLEDAVAACAAVEDEIGTLRALEENHWRDALRARCTCDALVLDALDSAVKDACAALGLTLHDHLIIGTSRELSFRAQGYL